MRHQPVHEVGRPGQVAAVFEDRDEDKEDEDLRQKGQHPAHAAEDAVGHQASQGPGRQPGAGPGAQGRHARADRADQRLGPHEDRLEDDHHHQGEDSRAPDAMGQHAVDPIARRGLVAGRFLDGPIEDLSGPVEAGRGLDPRHGTVHRSQLRPGRRQRLAHFPVGLGQERPQQVAVGVQQQPPHEIGGKRHSAGPASRQLRQPRLQPRDLALEDRRKRADDRRDRLPHHLGQGLFQQRQSHAAMGLDGHHRHAQPLGQLRPVDADATPLGQINHVHRQHRRPLELQHLAEQVEVALEVRGVEDRDHRVDRGQALAATQKDFHRNRLVARSRREAIQAGQIHQVPAAAVVLHLAGLLLHRHAGVVAHVLMETGQRAEERRLAGIGVADQGDRQGFRGGSNRHGRNSDFKFQILDSVSDPKTKNPKSKI